MSGNAEVLQKLVGIIAGSASIVSACINFLTLFFKLSAAPLDALTNLWVLLLLAGGGAWIVTGLVPGPFLQGVQVCVFYVVSVAIALGSHPGNITSALFLIYAGVLLTEYFPRRPSLRWLMVPSSGIYAAALFIGITHYTDGYVAVSVSSLLVVATGVTLYGVVLLRHWTRHRQEADLLEERVRLRTAELEDALRERVVMLQEIHHRVKNNLQIVASLLRLEASKVDDDAMRRPMETSIERIHAMALAHETLYQSEGLRQVDLGRYTRDFVAAISGGVGSIVTYEPGKGLPINVDLDFAVTFGLLLNELVAATVEYTRREEATGSIRVTLDHERGIGLVVEDARTGMAREAGTGTPQGLGFTIVRSLVDQLHGTITTERSPRTVWRLHFPDKT